MDDAYQRLDPLEGARRMLGWPYYRVPNVLIVSKSDARERQELGWRCFASILRSCVHPSSFLLSLTLRRNECLYQL